MTSSASAGRVQTMKYSLCISSNEPTVSDLTSSLWETHYKSQADAVTVGSRAGHPAGSQLTVMAFWRANDPRLMMDSVLLKNSFGKGHRCCRPFPPNKFYTIPFLKLISCALIPGVRIPEGSPPHHSPVLTLGVPTVRAMRTRASAFPMMLTTNMIFRGVGIQTFSVPPNNFILFPLFVKQKNYFSNYPAKSQ